MKPLRFGILATGKIAGRLANTMQASSSTELVAAASRSAESARLFSEKYGVEGVVGYEELLRREDIEAVYLAMPHPQHFEWCMKAIEHGKSVLCEKPLTMTAGQAEEIATLAEEKGVLVVEAFMYRFHPQTKLAAELIGAGRIGEVRWISADFGFAAQYDPQSRLFAKELGGGGILDIGCYTVSMTRRLAGAAIGKPFLNPTTVNAVGKLNQVEGTDWMAGAVLDFPGEILGTVRCSTRFSLGQIVRVEGTKGVLEIHQPWFAGKQGARLKIATSEGEEVISTEDPADLYSFMLEEFAKCHREKKTVCETMSPDDSLGNMRVLEEWYRQIGVEYPD